MTLLQGGPSASGKNYVDDNLAIALGWIGGVKHVLKEPKQGIVMQDDIFHGSLVKKLLVVSLEIHICRISMHMFTNVRDMQISKALAADSFV